MTAVTNIVIENWIEYSDHVVVSYYANGEPRTKGVGRFSVFANSLRDYDSTECERMLEEYERRKETIGQ